MLLFMLTPFLQLWGLRRWRSSCMTGIAKGFFLLMNINNHRASKRRLVAHISHYIFPFSFMPASIWIIRLHFLGFRIHMTRLIPPSLFYQCGICSGHFICVSLLRLYIQIQICSQVIPQPVKNQVISLNNWEWLKTELTMIYFLQIKGINNWNENQITRIQKNHCHPPKKHSIHFLLLLCPFHFSARQLHIPADAKLYEKLLCWIK